MVYSGLIGQGRGTRNKRSFGGSVHLYRLLATFSKTRSDMRSFAKEHENRQYIYIAYVSHVIPLSFIVAKMCKRD